MYLLGWSRRRSVLEMLVSQSLHRCEMHFSKHDHDDGFTCVIHLVWEKGYLLVRGVLSVACCIGFDVCTVLS